MKTKNIFFDYYRYFQNPKQIYRKLLPSAIVRRVDRFPKDCNERIRDIVGNVILFPYPSMPWNFLFQRTHQLAKVFSRCGFTILYATGTLHDNPDDVFGIKRVSDNIYLFNDGYGGKSLKDLKTPVTIWQHLTTQDDFIGHVSKKGIRVYDYIDHLKVFSNFSPEMERRHKELLQEADIVVCSSEKLYQEAKEYRDEVFYIPNGVDFEHFSKPVDITIPKLIKLRRDYMVIVGFYGSIADWIDYDIITRCAEMRPEYLFLLIGHPFPGIIERYGLDKHKNIKILKHVSYRELPQYLSVFDVATAPFKVNDITNSADPIKLYEYIAAGKPVVATDLLQFQRFHNILIAKDENDFIELIDRALLLKDDREYTSKLQKEASKHTWTKRIEDIKPFLLSQKYHE